MAGSLKGLMIRATLLAGSAAMSSATLESNLTGADTSYRAAFQMMLNDRASSRALVESSAAVGVLDGSATALTYLYNSTAFRDVLKRSGVGVMNVLGLTNFPLKFQPVMAAWCNDPTSVLRRRVYEASGTWQITPGRQLLAYSAVAVGGGGAGGTAYNGAGDTGGGGGQTKSTGTVTTNLPVAQVVAVTVPAVGTGGSASFGSFVTALGGQAGHGGSPNGQGGGSGTTVGSFASVTLGLTLDQTFWVKEQITIPGGNGGACGAALNQAAANGTGQNYGQGAPASGSYISGGGGGGGSLFGLYDATAGGSTTVSGGASPGGGGAGSNNGSGGAGGKFGGGGGANSSQNSGTGAQGAQGLVVVFSIEA